MSSTPDQIYPSSYRSNKPQLLPLQQAPAPTAPTSPSSYRSNKPQLLLLQQAPGLGGPLFRAAKCQTYRTIKIYEKLSLTISFETILKA